MGKKKQRVPRYVVIAGIGDPCPRCALPTEIREHIEITEKHLAQPFYYSRWFNCNNPRCRTTLVMPSKFIIWKNQHEVWE